jgi:hypothetical protein
MGAARPSMARQSLAVLLAVTRAPLRGRRRCPFGCASGCAACVADISSGGFFQGGLSGLRIAPTGVHGARVLAPAVLATGVDSVPSGPLVCACAPPSSVVTLPASSGSSAKTLEVRRLGARQGGEVPGCTILLD